MMTNEKMELKAYKMLAQLRGQLLDKIQFEARNKVEYKPEESKLLVENISNPAKWDYYGLLKQEDKKALEVLEYLLDDDATEIHVRNEWKPQPPF